MSFSRREQYAMLVLMIVLMILVVINLFPGMIIKRQALPLHNLDSIIALRDQFQQEEQKEKKTFFDIANPEAEALADRLKPFPFDPNHLPEDDWRKMGLTEKQIKNILNFEKSGGKFLKNSDLQKIYSLTLAEYRVLEPFIRIEGLDEKTSIPDRNSDSTDVAVNRPFTAIELNSADSLQLVELPGIGPWFAHRILQYRRSLGGYLQKEQLREVFGIDSVKYLKIEGYFIVEARVQTYLDLNRRTFKELMKHPYMNYELTKAVVNKRERQGFVKSWNELVGLNKGDSLGIKRLKPYLRYN
jgi:DNA uptake protein ComE-like DNA-binding protein